MSSKRPFVRGNLVGSDMAQAEELQNGTDLELPPGGSVVDEHGADQLERVQETDHGLLQPDTVLTAEMEYSGNDFVRSNADTSWLTLPAARVAYPRLLRHGRIEFEVTGTYFNTGAVVQTLDFELVVDGTPTGAMLSYPITAVGGNPSFLLFAAVLRIVGSIDGNTLYDLEGRLRMQRGDVGTYDLMIDSTKAVRPTIDGTASRTLNFRARRRNNVTNEAFLLRSFMAHQPLYRSGV